MERLKRAEIEKQEALAVAVSHHLAKQGIDSDRHQRRERQRREAAEGAPHAAGSISDDEQASDALEAAAVRAMGALDSEPSEIELSLPEEMRYMRPHGSRTARTRHSLGGAHRLAVISAVCAMWPRWHVRALLIGPM